ncbi:PP2C family serine/threonine-protein phosphatase [Fusobacterium mortiferum]|jgi:serine/threonine protein phosphatase PrpC|uniref:PP2C family protein-serine/threonine phosphatase n=1 Tax=Fusobacterium mortiferum TaxID=850 RepID=UPI001F474631|nr:PP2C family serine/threonine-protein phosphatase [Fusobacterium mortiferum]MCF2699186.1 serine/threonine-protein phosphatase [Fusobacterium mortiferum]MCI7664660.1 serine/threonine-protein phosphatase [Fusobacterium mortiferum]
MEVFYSTQIGNRKKNEDSILINKNLINSPTLKLKKATNINKVTNKFIICDGIGGGSYGEKASQIVLEIFSKSFRQVDEKIIKELCYKAYEKLEWFSIVNNINYIGTTIAGVLLNENKNIAFNLGDTRIYKISATTIELLSKDHTLARELYERGEISKEYISFHSSRHILTKSISSGKLFTKEDVFFKEFSFKKDEIILICSDGIWEQLNDLEILKIFKKGKNFKKIIENFLSTVEREPNDNMSFIVIKK